MRQIWGFDWFFHKSDDSGMVVSAAAKGKKRGEGLGAFSS